MNTYRYQDIEIGSDAVFSRQVTEALLDSFKLISEDYNPLHVDREYAKSQGFSDKVAYGMLAASFYSALAGMYLPGKYCLLQSISIDFIKPVYVGDILTIYGKVVEKNDSVRRIVINGYTKKQDGKKVSRVRMEVGVLDDE